MGEHPVRLEFAWDTAAFRLESKLAAKEDDITEIARALVHLRDVTKTPRFPGATFVFKGAKPLEIENLDSVATVRSDVSAALLQSIYSSDDSALHDSAAILGFDPVKGRNALLMSGAMLLRNLNAVPLEDRNRFKELSIFNRTGTASALYTAVTTDATVVKVSANTGRAVTFFREGWVHKCAIDVGHGDLEALLRRVLGSYEAVD